MCVVRAPSVAGGVIERADLDVGWYGGLEELRLHLSCGCFLVLEFAEEKAK